MEGTPFTQHTRLTARESVAYRQIAHTNSQSYCVARDYDGMYSTWLRITHRYRWYIGTVCTGLQCVSYTAEIINRGKWLFQNITIPLKLSQPDRGYNVTTSYLVTYLSFCGNSLVTGAGSFLVRGSGDGGSDLKHAQSSEIDVKKL